MVDTHDLFRKLGAGATFDLKRFKDDADQFQVKKNMFAFGARKEKSQKFRKNLHLVYTKEQCLYFHKQVTTALAGVWESTQRNPVLDGWARKSYAFFIVSLFGQWGKGLPCLKLPFFWMK